MAAYFILDMYEYIHYSLSKCPFLAMLLNEDIDMVAVWMSICPRDTAHWSDPIIDWYIAIPSESS